MNDKYEKGRTCVYCMHYHIVWCVKYRKKILTKEISERLYEIIQQTASEKGFTVNTCKTGLMDHVHCFISAPPKLSITAIVKYLKGISGNKLMKEFPQLKDQLWKGQLWNNSYFCETIGSVSETAVQKYIERQRTCQL